MWLVGGCCEGWLVEVDVGMGLQETFPLKGDGFVSTGKGSNRSTMSSCRCPFLKIHRLVIVITRRAPSLEIKVFFRVFGSSQFPC